MRDVGLQPRRFLIPFPTWPMTPVDTSWQKTGWPSSMIEITFRQRGRMCWRRSWSRSSSPRVIGWERIRGS